MTHTQQTSSATRPHAVALAIMLLIYGVHTDTAFSANLPIADGPVGMGVTSNTVKPNVAMVIDDSGSMNEIFMPDSISGKYDERCFGYKGHNTMAYDPTYTYKPPYKPGGTTYSDANRVMAMPAFLQLCMMATSRFWRVTPLMDRPTSPSI